MFPEGVTRIGHALVQIAREVQLFTQRAPVLNRLRLTSFSFPDFTCHRKQVIGMSCKNKQATIVISENHITAFDDKIPETRRVQCRGIASVEPLRPRRPSPEAENWHTHMSTHW